MRRWRGYGAALLVLPFLGCATLAKVQASCEILASERVCGVLDVLVGVGQDAKDTVDAVKDSVAKDTPES